MAIILFLLFASGITGAFFYRMRGGMPSVPRPIGQMLFCTLFVFVLAAFGVPIWLNISAYALAVLAVSTGHGQYFLSLPFKPMERERIDFILSYMFGVDPRTDFWGEPEIETPDHIVKKLSDLIIEYGDNKLFIRCLAGLSITGGIVSLAPGIALMTADIWAGITLALSGFITKPLGYYAAHMSGYNTEGGEYLHGGLQWLIGAAIVAPGPVMLALAVMS